MNHKTLIERFEHEKLKAGDLTHTEHVRLAWTYLGVLAVPETMIKMRDGLRQFTRGLGVPEKYHETVTFAYVTLIAQRMDKSSGEWEDFVADNPDLFEHWQALMNRYYLEDTLASAKARRRFVLPDRIPVSDPV